MKKRVVIINDELGTMALGFSKAGYDISAICIGQNDKNAIHALKENWGNVVRVVDTDVNTYGDAMTDLDVECIAGRILFEFSTAGSGRKSGDKNNFLLQAVRLLEEKKPKCFLFQCNRISDRNPDWNWLHDHVIQFGYKIQYHSIDTRLMTGLPVNEKTYIVFGSLDSNRINLELLKNVDTYEYTFEHICEKKTVDEWYYQVPQRHLQNMERYSENAFLCWSQNHYKEFEFVRWNKRVWVPLIAQGQMIRRITHREIARLKGIPDEYFLYIQNRSWLYDKLMSASNVYMLQQIASAICIDSQEEYFQKREITKGVQFEKIITSFWKQKGIGSINAVADINSNIDLEVKTDEGIYCFDFRIYRNNYGIEDKLIALCEKRYKRERSDDTNEILVVGNIVDRAAKKKIETKYKIIIWDVENLLWMFEEFPQIKSDFIAMLSFSVEDIVPQKPEVYIFEHNQYGDSKVDLQERLRKVQAGENAQKYEKICEEIMRYLFSDNLEFFNSQKISNDGLYRFDYCAKIKHGNTNEFFDTIKNFFRTKYVVFEFKNHKEEITQKEIYTTEKYLYETALRKVAIIVSRKGADTNAQKAARGSLREAGKLIICLSDENINKLIDMKNNKEAPGDYLEVLLDEMLLDLEK
ncbi:MAG: DNA cytosine methyltransferase [Lachnospiraceae bacterium]|nr:DNA cytosine methyltransferase [Lachnospiraceae bacterium]